jgi:protein-disulfide isomerase
MRGRRCGGRLLAIVASALTAAVSLSATVQGLGPAPQASAQTMPALPRIGPDKPPVTVVFFADFADPECGAAAVVLKALLAGDPERIALVFRHRPAPGRPERLPAHYAAVAAGEQDRFWEMAEVLFANQMTQRPADLAAMAAQIGLDGERFAADLSNAALQARVAQDLKDAATLKVTAVPSFVINGRTVAGRKTLGELTDLVAEALAAPAPRRHR